MQHLHDRQKKILEHLLDHPQGSTADELCDVAGVTKTAIKAHITQLETLGYLEHRDQKIGVGRPRRFYTLSAEGGEAFPRQYAWLSSTLLGFLSEEMDSAALSQMMERLAGKVASSMRPRFERHKNSKDLFNEICLVLNELGYRASIRQNDLRKGVIIEATNCVYHAIAKEHPSLCSFDRTFIAQVSGGMQVQQESCIARGGQSCRFCVKK